MSQSPVKQYADQVGRLYDSILNSDAYQRWMMESTAATPDPEARVGESQAEARSRRWGWLNQADIDRPLPPQPRRTLRQWLSEIPGGVSTLAVIVAFFAGMWGAYLIYQLLTSPEAVKAVSTAGRG